MNLHTVSKELEQEIEVIKNKITNYYGSAYLCVALRKKTIPCRYLALSELKNLSSLTRFFPFLTSCGSVE